jgi:hypothetical protein
LDHNLRLDPLPLNQARPGQRRYGGPTYLARDMGQPSGDARSDIQITRVGATSGGRRGDRVADHIGYL